MLRMEIEFDTEQIKKESLVTENMLYERIEKVIEEVHLRKVDKGIYQDAGNSEDLTNFMAIMSWLMKAKWFCRYVKRWDWYNDRLGTIKDILPENLLEGI